MTTENTDNAPGKVDGYTAAEWAQMYHQAAAQHNDDLIRVSDWQRRLQAEQEIVYAVELADGTVKHECDNFDDADLAASLHDNAHVVYTQRFPWKRMPARSGTIDDG